MSIRVGLGEYILQTDNSKKLLKIQWGLKPLNPSPSVFKSWPRMPYDQPCAFNKDSIFTVLYFTFIEQP